MSTAKRKAPSTAHDRWIRLLQLLQQGLAAYVIFTLPLLLYIGNSEYGYTKTIYAYVAITLLYALWGAQCWLQRKAVLLRPALFWPMAALLGAGLLSLIDATAPGITLQSVGVMLYFILLYLYIANHAQDRRTLYLFVAAGVLAALCSSLYGLLQYKGVVLGRPGVPSGNDAMISSMGNKNFLAEFINLWIIPGLVLLVGLKSAWSRLAVLGATAVIVIAFLAADSTGALVGLVGGCVVWAAGCLTFPRLLRWTLGRIRWVGLWVALLALLLALGPLGWLKPMLTAQEVQHASLATDSPSLPPSLLQGPIEQLQNMIGALWQAGSGSTRAWDWWIAVEMFKSHPLFGVGLGHYKVLFVDYKIKFLRTEEGKAYDFEIRRAAQAHNDYLQAAAEMGSVGVAALLFGLLTLVWQALRQVWNSRGNRQFVALALYSGALVLFIDAVINFPAHLAASAFSAVLLLGLAHSPAVTDRSKTFTLQGVKLRALVIVLLIFSCAVSVLAYRDWAANVYFDRGNSYLDQGLYQLAREDFEKSLALDFQPAELLYKLGIVHQALGDPGQAEVYFERAMGSFMVEELFLTLGTLKYQRGDYDGAEALLQKLVASKPDEQLLREAQLIGAMTQVRKGNLAQGMAQLEALLEKYPTFERVYFSLGEAALLQGNRVLALDYYQRSLGLVEANLKSLQTQWDESQGKQMPISEYARLRSNLERYAKMREEIQKTIAQLSGAQTP